MKKTKQTKTAVKRVRAPKTRNSSTLTESAFWSFIRSSLRQRSRWWKPITECKNKAKRLYKGTNKRQKFEYQCNQCKDWFIGTAVNVDHIVPAGTLTCADDLPAFVERLFCEIDNLQVLCEKCHNVKTQLEKDGKTSKSIN